MSRDDVARGGRAVLGAIDAEDQRAELARARRAGEVAPRTGAVVVPLRPPAPVKSREELVQAYWRWAAWACPDGVPPGWSEEGRPT